jgi:hypothetical protein
MGRSGLLTVGALALRLVEDYLAKAEVMRCNFHIFIAFDIFQSFFE